MSLFKYSASVLLFGIFSISSLSQAQKPSIQDVQVLNTSENTLSTKKSTNTKPFIIPSLRYWRGGHGYFNLTDQTRIIIRSKDLQALANQFSSDLLYVSGIQSKVVLSKDAKPKKSDIVFAISEKLKVKNSNTYLLEGYNIHIGHFISLTAPKYQGLAFGTRTLIQQFILDKKNKSFPKGEIIDYPQYRERAFMLDVGRKFFDTSFLKDYIRFLSFFKINILHLHLNDNKIGATSLNDYSAFRLKSENPKWKKLAATDGAYTRRDWQELENIAQIYGVQILPEIDGPAHALAFTKFSLEEQQKNIHLTHSPDQLDLEKPESLQLMKDIYSEFAPWFSSPEIHIGGDEYFGKSSHYINYLNLINRHLRSVGKKTRIWGSLYGKNINPKYLSKQGVNIDSWDDHWYSLARSVRDGFMTTNTPSRILYIVPKGDFWSYNPNGLNNERIYHFWTPEKTDLYSSAAVTAVHRKHPRLLGAKMAVWNDQAARSFSYSQNYVHSLLQNSIGVFAQKTWSSYDKLPSTYPVFLKFQHLLGVGPNTTVIKNLYAGKTRDIAFGQKAFASSSAVGHPARYANDNNAQSRWISRTPNKKEWLAIDLEKQYDLEKVVIHWENVKAAYDLQISNDAKTWQTLFTGTSQENSRPDIIHLANSDKTKPRKYPRARYIRVRGHSVTSAESSRVVEPYAIWDLEIYPAP